MSGKNAEREQRRQDAQERAFEALLEQELGAGAPVAAILARARATDGRERSPGRTRRSLLVAAVVLLGAGVVAFAAWQGRVGRGGDEAEQQGLTEPVDLLWPDGSPRAYRPSDLDSLRADLTHLRLSAPLHEIGALSRFAELQQLYVALTPSKVWRPVMSGEAARARDRLGVLSTTPELRRLSLGGVAVEPEDLRSLRHLRHLQVLELNSLMPTVADDEMREAAKLGGFLAGRSFDLALAEEVAASARCGTLRLSGMEVTAAALQALAPMGLRALAVETPTGTGPAALRALGQLTTLERLELRCVHVTDVPGEAAQLGGIGAAALAPDVMRAIAALPKLRSLVLEACVLDHELLAALPTGLSELDLRGCLGVDGRLADIVARMPNLRSLGVPLAMQQGRDFGSMLRPPLEGDVARTM
ncbi:MAG: hypothetical protein KAI24_10060, partial [Planctomycetes bacterium]|nr:hypothetical protein [Planctomycetota bacterium]